MFKFLVLGAFIAQAVVNDCYGQMQSSSPDSESNIIEQSTSSPGKNSIDELPLQKDEQYPIYASRLNLSLGDSFEPKSPIGFSSNLVGWKLDADYVVTKGIGAHKLHVRKLSWAKASKTCIEEGGHLVVIRTDAEEKVILKMMSRKSIDLAWAGYHDLFEEGDWFSVTGELLAQTGWSRWSPEFATNPIPNNGHCAELKRAGGLVNIGCAEKRSFICKVLIDS